MIVQKNEAGRLCKEWISRMELELEKTQMSGFDEVLDTTVFREETMEMIVPDACPDILRIVETEGTACLRTREVGDGRVEVSGAVEAAVLYLPDGETGMRHLEVNIPFACTVESGEVGASCAVVAAVRVRGADARAVNPRKILVRVEAAVDVQVFAPVSDELCQRIQTDGQDGVQQLTETQEVYVTACVEEKPFPFSDEIALSASRPAAAELLKSRIDLVCNESKIIGNKLIFKASANVQLLYRGEDAGLYSAGYELPLSQIMEVTGVGEGAECELSLDLTGRTCALVAGGEGRAVSVDLEILAQAVVREGRTFTLLTDAYSTKTPVAAERTPCRLARRVDMGVRSQPGREVWECVPPARDVVDCALELGQVSRVREGEKWILTAEAALCVLYVGDDGESYAARKTVSVPCTLEGPENCLCVCRCQTAGDVYASAAAGGLEVRFTLDFRYLALDHREVLGVSALHPVEEPERTGEQPSLVLRTLEPGERLWDVAKAYRTTVDDVMSANELEEESAARGRLLLIPRKR